MKGTPTVNACKCPIERLCKNKTYLKDHFVGFFHKIFFPVIILPIYGILESWESGKSGIGTNLFPKMRQKIVLCPGKTRRRSLKSEFEKFYDVFQKLFFYFFEMISNDFLTHLTRIFNLIQKLQI